MVPKSPSKANDARQPRQSSGTAIPAIKPRILPAPAPAPRPAPTPPDIGARGINVGLRLKISTPIYYFFIFKKRNLHRISTSTSVWSWWDGHIADLYTKSPIDNDLI